MNDLLFLDVHINTLASLSVDYFKIIADILRNNIKYNYYEKFNAMESVIFKLSDYAESISLGLEYGSLTNDLYNEDYNYDYEYLLNMMGIYGSKSRKQPVRGTGV